MKSEKLSDSEISAGLKNLNNWTLESDSIKKTFKTDGFPQTMGLTSAICGICQQFDHHPDYLTLKYSTVEVSFSSHSAGGLTSKDFEIAKEIDKLKY